MFGSISVVQAVGARSARRRPRHSAKEANRRVCMAFLVRVGGKEAAEGYARGCCLLRLRPRSHVVFGRWAVRRQGQGCRGRV